MSLDPEVIAGSGCAICGLTDLLELSDLVAHLMSRKRISEARECKENYAASVKQKTPQSAWSLR